MTTSFSKWPRLKYISIKSLCVSCIFSWIKNKLSKPLGCFILFYFESQIGNTKWLTSRVKTVNLWFSLWNWRNRCCFRKANVPWYYCSKLFFLWKTLASYFLNFSSPAYSQYKKNNMLFFKPNSAFSWLFLFSRETLCMFWRTKSGLGYW